MHTLYYYDIQQSASYAHSRHSTAQAQTLATSTTSMYITSSNNVNDGKWLLWSMIMMTFSKDINIHAGIIRLIEMVLWMNAVTIGYDESERTNERTWRKQN